MPRTQSNHERIDPANPASRVFTASRWNALLRDLREAALDAGVAQADTVGGLLQAGALLVAGSGVNAVENAVLVRLDGRWIAVPPPADPGSADWALWIVDGEPEWRQEATSAVLADGIWQRGQALRWAGGV